MSEPIKKLLIALTLGLLVVSAFFIRLENFKKSTTWTIDEIVYYRMALQVLEDPADYNTIPYGKELAARGRPLPQYFFEPLFKHPPLFTFLCASSMKIFGPTFDAAFYVSLIFGALMIPLTYVLAAFLLNRQAAFLCALFMWADPVTLISSQKVWMDTTVSFFMVAAVYLFLSGLKTKSNGLFIWTGIALGLALLTKYSGIIMLGVILLYAFSKERQLLRNRFFQLMCLVPFIMLIPWLLWNWVVYKEIFVKKIFGLHGGPVGIILAAIGVIVAGFFIFRKLLPYIEKKGSVSSADNRVLNLMYLGMGIILFFFILSQIFHAFGLTHFPVHTWAQGVTHNMPPTFYIGQLIEFSPIYIFSFAGIFLRDPKRLSEMFIVYLSACVILVFFIAWGGYQSRYILAAVPFLIILGVDLWMRLFDKVSESGNTAVYVLGRLVLRGFLVWCFVKVHYINLLLSYTNDMCYF